VGRHSRSRLSDLGIGDEAQVIEVGGQRNVARRLMEMGLLPGTRVRVVRRAPLGDPLEIRLRSYSLSIRRSEAEHIEIEPLPGSEPRS
jgi:ferrous iron transport protein A